MITDPKYLASEVKRLEENLLSYSGSRQWQIVGVVIPTTEGQDVDVVHTLTPSNPDNIDVQILSANAPLMVFRGSGPWTNGLIKLRGTTPGAQAVLLLSIANDNSTRTPPATQPAMTAGGMSNRGLFQNAPLFGYNGAKLGMVGSFSMPWDAFVGSGIEITDRYYASTEQWQIGMDRGNGPSDVRVNIADRRLGYVPFMFRQQSGDYFLQPGPATNPHVGVNLGNPNDGAFTGYWDNVYAVQYNEPGFSGGIGKWVAFSPTITNLTLGNGQLVANRTRVGDTTFVDVFILFGSTTSVTGALSITNLPTNNSALGVGLRIGHIGMLDSSAAAIYTGAVHSAGVTSGTLYSGAQPAVQLNTTVPFTWATNDQCHLFIAYRNT